MYSLIELILALIVFLSALYSIKSNPTCSIAVICCLLFAALLDYIGQQQIHPHMMFFCFFMCVFKTDGKRIIFIDVKENELIYAIALFYPIRMIFGFAATEYQVNTEIAWRVTTLLLLLQVSLLVLGAVNGGTRRVNDLHIDFWNHTDRQVFGEKGI